MLRYGRWVLLVSLIWYAQPNINRPPGVGRFSHKRPNAPYNSTKGELSGHTFRPWRTAPSRLL